MAGHQKNNKKQKGRPSRGLFWIFIISLVFSQLFAYTWIRTESTHLLLDISKRQDELAQKQAMNKALEVERDRLESDDRIIRIAKTKLELLPETSVPTVYLAGDKG